MPQISAPYNFVPLNDEVFFPPWASFVSHDIPFKNGLSGKIELEITAESLIFIRGKEEDYAPNPEFKQYRFMQDDNGRFLIPGSSLKGEISDVLESLTFSKLSSYSNIRYSQREWDLENEIYDKTKFADVKGGWLSFNGESYIIKYNKDRNPGRISHKNIDSKFNTSFQSNFASNRFRLNDPKFKSALKKYELFNTNKLVNKFVEYNNNQFRVTDSGDEGTLVFTGQSSKRQQRKDRHTHELLFENDGTPKMSGKYLEFVFWEPNDSHKLKKDDIRIKSFFSAYYDGDSSNESIDWKESKKKLEQGDCIPIFITLDNDEIAHFGLSMLYKLPYDNSIKELLGDDHKDERLDFNECLFGNIDNNKLKGRVHFGHFFSESAEEDSLFTAVLGSPKPSYYPFYIQQDFKENTTEIRDRFQTYNDGEISGRKRYPIRNCVNDILANQAPNKLTTSFFPLKKGTKFIGCITFHNLLSEELGGLLSALTFHKQGKNYYHSIGMGKPLGLGKCKLDILSIEIDKKVDDIESFINEKLSLYEMAMQQFKKDWLTSEQLVELLAMAKPVDEQDELLAYMRLSIQPRINDYADVKRRPKKGLPRYSVFMNIRNRIEEKIKSKINTEHTNKSIYSSSDFNKMNEYSLVLKTFSESRNYLKRINEKQSVLKETEKNIKSAPEISLNFQKGQQIKAVISNLNKGKKAKINLANEIIEVQLIIDKFSFEKNKFNIGDTIDVIIQDIKKNGEIQSVKYLEKE